MIWKTPFIDQPITKQKGTEKMEQKLFDSHCHLDDASFSADLPEVMARGARAGVKAVMTVGITLETSEHAIALAEKYSGVYASIGIHPHDAAECSEKSLGRLKQLARHPKVRAWGETGLDFNRMFSPQQDQEHWFHRQIEIADELDLPLIFHERDSGGRFLDILKSHHRRSRRGVVHCFSGTVEEMRNYVDMGLHIGITGILTNRQRGEQLREMVPEIPGDRLVVETDAPYLTPTPERNRFRRNEPAFVRSTFLKLAAVRGEEPAALAATIWNNTLQLFDITDIS
ncbi:MAG: TatD family hydrolase [Thermodesulfobacteriota bacterium]